MLLFSKTYESCNVNVIVASTDAVRKPFLKRGKRSIGCRWGGALPRARRGTLPGTWRRTLPGVWTSALPRAWMSALPGSIGGPEDGSGDRVRYRDEHPGVGGAELRVGRLGALRRASRTCPGCSAADLTRTLHGGWMSRRRGVRWRARQHTMRHKGT